MNQPMTRKLKPFLKMIFFDFQTKLKFLKRKKTMAAVGFEPTPPKRLVP